ncbi:MAG: DNA mismatch repair endonuclease MutL [Opitutales bacterium]|nr:DNA mismatch repair endonuclease MutL [Opitutales bacterium]
MPRVKILSEHVANQIAAGEVVERPVSVIKELLENAVDSGATRIRICFNDAGRSYISVEDNGCGMTREDAMTALERHATSKLTTSDDLDNIHTFGFRGEAIPSIASVSRMTIKTRPADQPAGTEIRVNGGRYTTCQDCGMAAGTTIVVETLFYNVPARLKFLKSLSTETAHITRAVRLYALAHPDIHFELVGDGRQIFISPAKTELLDRVCRIWGRQLYADLMILPPREAPGIKVWGLLGKPGVSRAGRQEIVTIVNRRPVDNRLMVNSLIESYHTLIPRGRYPLAYIFLEIDPHAIDVNIHPAKREIRFRDESKVRNFIMVAVLTALGLMRDDDAGKPVPEPHEHVPAANPVPATAAPATAAPAAKIPVPATVPTASAREQVSVPVPAKIIPAGTPPSRERGLMTGEDLARWQKSWRYLGQMSDSPVILFQAGEKLILFNEKYARERIVYEQILRGFEEGRAAPAQQLLFPEVLELSPLESDALRQGLEVFKNAGFEIETFGRDAFRLHTVPEWLDEAEDAKIFVRDLIERFRRFPSDYSRGNVAAETLAKLACEKIGKKTQMLDRAKTEQVLKELFKCAQPNTSPRGFRVFAEIPYGDILGKFGAKFDN